MEKKLPKVNRAQADLYADFMNTFNTPSGKRVLEYLEWDAGGECYVKGDLYETLRRTATRDFLDRIKSKLRKAEEGFEVEEEQIVEQEQKEE